MHENTSCSTDPLCRESIGYRNEITAKYRKLIAFSQGMSPGTHFAIGLWTHDYILVKISVAPIFILNTQSGHNSVHITTAQHMFNALVCFELQ